ncbi:hypothetical protein [Roseateles sp.]|uniref:hypothetical protein n=1 Tax=Roseateles sp. TaxID=1971397 RepID=UPI003263C70E
MEHLGDHERMQNLRRAQRLVGRQLGAKAAADPGVKELLALGCDSRIARTAIDGRRCAAREFERSVTSVSESTAICVRASAGDTPAPDRPRATQGTCQMACLLAGHLGLGP